MSTDRPVDGPATSLASSLRGQASARDASVESKASDEELRLRREARKLFSLSWGNSIRGPRYDKALERFENAFYKVHKLFQSLDDRHVR